LDGVNGAIEPAIPTIRPAGIHTCESRVGRTSYLPPYSSDLNPIERAFSKLKAHLRRIGARTFDTLFHALGDICDLFDPQECWNFLKAAGYASD